MEIEGLEFEYKKRPRASVIKNILERRVWILEHTVELHTLSERNRNILEERFGLFDETIRSYEVLAEKFDLSPKSFDSLVSGAIGDMKKAST